VGCVFPKLARGVKWVQKKKVGVEGKWCIITGKLQVGGVALDFTIWSDPGKNGGKEEARV